MTSAAGTLRPTMVIACVLQIVTGAPAPYRALLKWNAGNNRLPLYVPVMHHRLKPVQEDHNEPGPGDRGTKTNGNENPPPIVDKTKLLKCAEARFEEAAAAVETSGGSNVHMPSPDAIMNIVKATDFASHKHHYQRRKDPEGTPYIEHPVAVAHILTHVGKVSDPVVIMAALLHDTVEDTDTTFDEIEREFGPKVRSVVEELTDNKQMTRDERKKMQILHAAHSSPEAKLVKLADKLHNLRDIERSLPVNWTEERKTEYFNWARDVVRGLRGTNAPIEAELDKMFIKYCTPITNDQYR